MQDTAPSVWKRALRAGKRVHAAGAVLLLAAFACYIGSWTIGASAFAAAAFFLEMSGWIVLAMQSDGNSDPPRGGLR